MEKLDLGWGDPYFLLDILNKKFSRVMIIDFNKMTYEADKGNEHLLKCVKQITEHLTGNKYKHYLITNGATQAINSVIRVWKEERDIISCATSPLGYPFYPGMIKKAEIGQNRVDLNTYEPSINEMTIVDSPSNPLGEQFGSSIYIKDNRNVVWDAVYHNPIYNAEKLKQPNHEVFVGSFSKLLGVTGARVGWIAMNGDYDFELIAEESLLENATVCRLGQNLVSNILSKMGGIAGLEDFMDIGRKTLDNNRSILDGISKLLNFPVQEKGMFYCAQVDQKMYDLFDNSNIKYVKFDYQNNQFIRLNIGQTSDILQKAVKQIKKTDRRK